MTSGSGSGPEPGSNYSSERSTPEILRRIGLASNIFGKLHGQRLEADIIEFTDEDTALQCPCYLHTVIWIGNMDFPEG